MAVDVDWTGGAPRFGAPHVLFDSGALLVGPGLHVPPVTNYSVTSDGQRFLIARQVTSQGVRAGEVPVTVIVNWPGLLDE
jgi:hypothetical protein